MDPISFKDFCEPYDDDDTLLGNVVRDMFNDPEFPWNLKFGKPHKKYLKDKKATKEVIILYEELELQYIFYLEGVKIEYERRMRNVPY